MTTMNEHLKRKYPIETKAKSPKRKIPKKKKVDITTWKTFKKSDYIGMIAHNLCLQIIVEVNSKRLKALVFYWNQGIILLVNIL